MSRKWGASPALHPAALAGGGVRGRDAKGEKEATGREGCSQQALLSGGHAQPWDQGVGCGQEGQEL